MISNAAVRQFAIIIILNLSINAFADPSGQAYLEETSVTIKNNQSQGSHDNTYSNGLFCEYGALTPRLGAIITINNSAGERPIWVTSFLTVLEKTGITFSSTSNDISSPTKVYRKHGNSSTQTFLTVYDDLSVSLQTFLQSSSTPLPWTARYKSSALVVFASQPDGDVSAFRNFNQSDPYKFIKTPDLTSEDPSWNETSIELSYGFIETEPLDASGTISFAEVSECPTE
jgi:hypothetical protein